MADKTESKKVIDLRPPEGSLLRSLLRLGFAFNGSTGGEGTETPLAQQWADYSAGVTADIEGPDAPTVTLTDLASRLAAEVPASDLAACSKIVTWGNSPDPAE